MERTEISLAEGEMNWSYDEENDALYIYIGEPGPSLGLDLENGVAIRYHKSEEPGESKKEVVGITLVGFREALSDPHHPGFFPDGLSLGYIH